jgi:glycogen debranching enzyme
MRCAGFLLMAHPGCDVSITRPRKSTMTTTLEDRRAEAIAILKTNDMGGYTVPTAGLYPFQWNWDSAFCAMGFATFDQARAWDELDSLFLGQWADGLVPHIIFHTPSDTYFPGPEVWGTHHVPPTSGITQPPVAAIAARQIFETAADKAMAHRRCKALYPKLLASHRWWAKARDPDNTGLVAILHNWETGMDNSPAWDAALERVPRTKTAYVRKDTGHVDSAMRPKAIDYDRYVHLVETYRACQWDPAAMWAATPFKIAHIGINAILLRAEMDLLALASHFGSETERSEIGLRIAGMGKAMSALWSPKMQAFQSLDLISGERIPAATSAGFLPLLTDVPTADQAKAMADEMQRWTRLARHGVPTVAPDDPLFDGRRYWRGPVWCIVNWLLFDGLTRHGLEDAAAAVKAETKKLLLDKGFAEYFDPMDGTPCGGLGFSWTAAAGLAFALT